ARRRRCGRGPRARRRRRDRRAPPPCTCSREHAEVRGRDDADDLWNLLGRRGCRRRLAGRRRIAPRRARLRGPDLDRDGGTASAAQARARGGKRLNALRRFGSFWWDFVVGDDWRVAVGVALALGGSAALAAGGVTAWWALPVAMAALLYLSVRRAAR